MRQAGLQFVLWGIFAALVLTGGYATLRACDLGILPLLGYAACGAAPGDAAMAAERERQDDLRAAIHAAEVRVAMLPYCPKPAPPKPVEPPAPVPDPAKGPEKFEIPKKVEDLRGCWQSARGDISIETDDAERKKIGTARFCYCFRSNGQGTIQVRFSDGDLCRAGLRARISSDHVFMHHEKVLCRSHPPMVAADVSCGNDPANETVCQIQTLGNVGNKVSERFIRVSDEHCGWKE